MTFLTGRHRNAMFLGVFSKIRLLHPLHDFLRFRMSHRPDTSISSNFLSHVCFIVLYSFRIIYTLTGTRVWSVLSRPLPRLRSGLNSRAILARFYFWRMKKMIRNQKKSSCPAAARCSRGRANPTAL
ncbi:hypothetical protein L596_007317 [Steinernema carpocapsae]|uniref:Uncharacterized protein n=1 Tax=Steinernema carpocapsae TaxID=34508 RepID=A0A4U5P9B3_STECR|nr:hypothetical protein L596_007317 [Steinernema carpocapsae]